MTEPADEDVWVRRFHSAPRSRTTVVCFPHAGGAANFFHPLSAALRPAIQVAAMQYPGRHDRRRDPFLTSIEGLADGCFGSLRPLLDRPVAFFGHSMGATVAFEVARRMRRELGTAPVALFASGRRAPSRHRAESLHTRSDAALIAELKALSGTNARLLADAELLDLILPVIRADYTAVETYRFESGPVLNCPIIALIGDRDPRVTVDEARDWSQHTTGPFKLRKFTGGHFYLTDHLRAVVGTITQQLLSPARGA
jgi:surfactin synthase thioesterase subunit